MFFPRFSTHALLAMTSLSGLSLGTPVPETHHAIAKRALCVELYPGSITLMGQSNNPFVVCEGPPNQVSMWFQNDANLVVYDEYHNPIWNSGTGGHNCAGANNCTMAFQHDGNLVIYYNRAPIWYTSTGGNIGSVLQFQNDSPYMLIVNAKQQPVWQTGP